MKTFYLKKENQKQLLDELLLENTEKTIIINTDKNLKLERFEHISIINPMNFNMEKFLKENDKICIDLFDIDIKKLKKINFGDSIIDCPTQEKYIKRNFLMNFIRSFSNIDSINLSDSKSISFTPINLLGSLIEILMCLNETITLNNIKSEFKNEFREDIGKTIESMGMKMPFLIDYEKGKYEKVKDIMYDCLDSFINNEIYNTDVYTQILFWLLNNEIKRNYLYKSRFILIDYNNINLPCIQFKDMINIDIISSKYNSTSNGNDEYEFLNNFKILDKNTDTKNDMSGFLDKLIEYGKELDNNQISTASGEIKLRIPKSFHEQIKKSAKENGISMNQYILYLLTTAYYLNKK